jgi:glutathionyl-hydroquinone reductase
VGPDPLHPDILELRELYAKCDPEYSGRWTVPVLWDKKTETIVSNESSEIVRMLDNAFESLLGQAGRQSLYPQHLQSAIDEANSWHYADINNGV